MKKLKITFSLIVVTLFVNLVSCQQVNSLKLDSLLDILVVKHKSMGSMAIAKNGKIIYAKSIGIRFVNNGDTILSDSHTKYRIGSISKMFTATMIFQLIDEGKLTLTATLDQYFPEIPNAGKITIGNMLNHSSGLFNFTSDPSYLTWMTTPKTHEELLKIISDYKPVFEPGSKNEYSNTNYVLLGYIVEKIYNRPYAECLKNNIIKRIWLTGTSYGEKASAGNNECISFAFNKTWQPLPETDMSIPGGAGAIVATADDLTKFISALFSNKLVSEKSLATMRTLTNGFGMGMFPESFNGKSGFGHGGSIDGFTSYLVYYPEDSLAIAYCSNERGYPANTVKQDALTIYYGLPFKIPEFKTIALTSEELDKYLGVYSSKQLPLKITMSVASSGNDDWLIAQATGQSSFPLDATDKDVFKFDAAGIVLKFNTDKKEMVLEQGGGVFLFTKED